MNRIEFSILLFSIICCCCYSCDDDSPRFSHPSMFADDNFAESRIGWVNFDMNCSSFTRHLSCQRWEIFRWISHLIFNRNWFSAIETIASISLMELSDCHGILSLASSTFNHLQPTGMRNSTHCYNFSTQFHTMYFYFLSHFSSFPGCSPSQLPHSELVRCLSARNCPWNWSARNHRKELAWERHQLAVTFSSLRSPKRRLLNTIRKPINKGNRIDLNQLKKSLIEKYNFYAELSLSTTNNCNSLPISRQHHGIRLHSTLCHRDSTNSSWKQSTHVKSTRESSVLAA